MDKIYILTLLQTPKIGRKTAKQIINNCDFKVEDLKKLHDLIVYSKQKNRRIQIPDFVDLEKANYKAKNILKKSSSSKIKTISIFDEAYPQNFLQIKDNPVIIYVKGNINALNSINSVAVVGTRKPCNFSIESEKRLIKYFVEANLTIISGLAIGCDTVAHKETLNNNGITVAIMPRGLDGIYPKRNKKLANEILNKNGALLSEYPVGTETRKYYLVERDRLQSGLSNGICVIETGTRGGTMHTVKFANKQGKIVSALKFPKKRKNVSSAGNHELIRKGVAFPLGSKTDIKRFIEKVRIKENNSDSPIKKQQMFCL